MTLTTSPIISRKTILVIDDEELCREMTGDCLSTQGFNTLEADDGHSALVEMGRSHVDLIVLDHEMPGMDGLSFLKTLRADPQRCRIPVIMLTSSTSKDVVVEAMRLGVRGYLLKARFTMAELVSRINAILSGSEPAQHVLMSTAPKPAAMPQHLPPHRPAAVRPRSGPDGTIAAPAAKPAVPNLVTRSAITEAILEITSTKTLAGVVAEVVALAGSGHASLGELTGILKRDPVLSSRVIQLACSSAYLGSKSKLATIDEAVRAVGAVAIRDLALTVGIFDSFPPDRADGMDLLRCWQHAFGVAAAMERLVPRSDRVAAGTPHLIGLCHDLGEIMVRQRFPREYATAVELANQNDCSVYDHFPAAFGISMSELVETLLRKMKLPAVISDPIAEFSKSARLPLEAHGSTLARALAIANFFAHALELTASVEEPIAPALVCDCRTALLPTARLDWSNSRADATTTISALSKLKSDEAMALSRPSIAKQTCNVGYMRDHAFCELDPIEAALEALCDVTTLDKAARPDDLHGLSGLVVLCPAADNSLAAEALRLRGLAGVTIPILQIVPPKSHGLMPDAMAFETIAYPVTLKRLSRYISMLAQA
ncbi:MAG TPA: HDOD domain-containing protein [Tepidisphaeraceae bacterium]|jgi:two-component system chemotaxis response regulator CheY|nr:HDOD domain-containing protein [Tepidisphaeraceae bacterium]